MNSLFFYGSLRHVPLLETVLGRRLDAVNSRLAALAGYAVYAVAEGPFPMLVQQQGANAQGLVVTDLSKQDIARLDFYEGGFDYDLIDVSLEDGTLAQVYVCAADRWQALDVWDFSDWEQRWAEMSCFAAVEVMGYFLTHTRDQVAAMFPQIRARAWSKFLGAYRHAGQGVFEGKVEIEKITRAYVGYFAFDEVSLRHERFDGSMSELLERSYMVAGDAALVLPYDPVRDRVLLVEQVRMGPIGRGDPEIWHLEPIAGRIDPGETAEQAAQREAREEASLDLSKLELVSKGYASPGESTAYFHIFVGLADLPDAAAVIGGLAEEQENIRSRLISFDKFMKMAERQSLANTPLALLAYWLAYHRSRLRS